jgi:HlyD family secretion protein
MTKTSASPPQLRQTREHLQSEDYACQELAKAISELPPLYMQLLSGGICLLITSVIAWAHFSRVDEVAVANGEFVPSMEVRPVHALESGILKAVKVKEGDKVVAGTVLIELDPSIPKAEIQRLENLANLLKQDMSRLKAEQAGKSDTGAELQDRLLASRLRDFNSSLEKARAEVSRQQSVIAAAQAQLGGLEAELGYARDKERRLSSLMKTGAAPRFDYIDAQSKVASLSKGIEAKIQEIHQAEQAYRSANQEVTQLTAARESEILSQLSKQQQTLADLEGQLNKSRMQRDLSTIKASVSGIVYNVKATKAGVNIQSGDELLSILPEGEELVLQANVLNRDIGFVKANMPVKVKLATYPYQEFGTLEGEASQVSPNSHVDKELGAVFSTKVRIKKNTSRGREILLLPGMDATAEIVLRKRSILSFLLEPILDRWDKAFSTR